MIEIGILHRVSNETLVPFADNICFINRQLCQPLNPNSFVSYKLLNCNPTYEPRGDGLTILKRIKYHL